MNFHRSGFAGTCRVEGSVEVLGGVAARCSRLEIRFSLMPPPEMVPSEAIGGGDTSRPAEVEVPMTLRAGPMRRRVSRKDAFSEF